MRERLLAMQQFHAHKWADDALHVLDMRRLPSEQHWLKCQTVAEVANAIKTHAVQGASSVGISAAYGLLLGLREHLAHADDWRIALEDDYQALLEANPYAANLRWALNQMIDHFDRLSAEDDIWQQGLAMAQHIQGSDLEANLTMAQLGLDVLREHLDEPQQIMVHGAVGALATGGLGSALGVVKAAHLHKRIEHVFVTQALPLGQGMPVAWELEQLDVEHSLHTDNSAAHLMKTAPISWVMVGAECIAANGDVIGALGTYQLAINAMHHGIRLMVVAPSSSLDLHLESGEHFDWTPESQSDAPLRQAKVDVTPADLIDYLVTEKGVVARPNLEKMAKLMCRKRLH